ncbi:sensor domain-containing protein [Streptomyces sp. CA-111067]|uniref:sensor domain-containing protein n=1 Tax=Streptomyces sp. CA-111067 TaxID=3240046 RepID=UPI003D95AE91
MPIRSHSRLLTGSRGQAADLRRDRGQVLGRGLGPGRGPGRSRRRSAVLLGAALVPALALTAACGGGGGDDKAKKPGPVVASGAVSVGKLTSSLLGNSDVPHVQVLPAGDKSQLLGGGGSVEEPACQPIYDEWSSQPKHPRQVYTGAMVTDSSSPDKGAKAISLSVIASYKKGEARAVLDDLTAALKTCTGYKILREGTTTSFVVGSAKAAPGLGDQAVAYTVGDKSKGPAGTILVTVVRVGDTTAAYETIRADHKAATINPAIPLKQAAKLRTAASGK